MKKTYQGSSWEWNSERRLQPTGLFFPEPEKITMILLFFLSLLFYTLTVTAAGNREEGRNHFRTSLAAWFGAWRNSRPAHHHRSNRQETRKEQMRAIPGKKLGLISRCHIEVQLIQNGIWGKKTKAVRVNKLILWKIIMPHRYKFPISISNSN